jgi:hypothetical protein
MDSLPRSTLDGVTSPIDALRAAIHTPSFTGACAGRHDLFDSHDAADVAACIEICEHCPVLVACRQFVNALPPAQRPNDCVVAGAVQHRVRPRHKRSEPVPPVSPMRRAARSWPSRSTRNEHTLENTEAS